MAGAPGILIKIGADTAQAVSGIDSISKKLGGFAKVAAGVAIAAGAAFAVDKMAEFTAGAVNAGAEAAKADARFQQIATSMGFVGGAYEGATQRASDFASKMSMTIGVEDEAIKSTQALLATFGNVGKTMDEAGGVFDRATAAAHDLSAAGFGSAEGAAKMLGKALNDPVKGMTAMTKAGVTFTQAQKDQVAAMVEANDLAGAQALILAEVEKQVGGTAEAMATGMDRIKVAFGEVQEALGTALLPAIEGIATALLPAIEALTPAAEELGKVLGENLTAIFEELAPVLPPLVEAISSLAKVAGGILTIAVKTLVPIIKPLLTILSDMATKIGPILTPILSKIGQLIGKVMEAVIPLIEPLLTLVFTIFQGAAPIIGLAVDVLIMLVDALKPILKVVGLLLEPLTILIETLFAAIMPVLEPVLPILTLLANIIGVILTKAVGLLMMGLGGLLKGLGTLAPFVAQYVAKPVIDLFITMATKVLEAAEGMFGWIPGIGDKVRDAKAGIAGLSSSVQGAIKTMASGVNSAADSLISSGMKAFEGNGLDTMIAAAGKVGTETGSAIGKGTAKGLKAAAPVVETAGADTGKKAGGAAKKAAEKELATINFRPMLKQVEAEFGYSFGEISKFPKTITEGTQKTFETALKTSQEFITKQTEIIKKGQEEIARISSEITSKVMGKLGFQMEKEVADAEGKMQKVAMTPEEMVNAFFGDMEKQRAVVDSVATNIGTALPPALLSKIMEMPADTAIAMADYLGKNPEMMKKMVENYDALAIYTEQTLGKPMGEAWAKIGNDSAVDMIDSAKKAIDAEKESFTKWVRSKLKTKITVEVEYKAINNPPAGVASGSAVGQIQQFEALNGRSWRA